MDMLIVKVDDTTERIACYNVRPVLVNFDFFDFYVCYHEAPRFPPGWYDLSTYLTGLNIGTFQLFDRNEVEMSHRLQIQKYIDYMIKVTGGRIRASILQAFREKIINDRDILP